MSWRAVWAGSDRSSLRCCPVLWKRRSRLDGRLCEPTIRRWAMAAGPCRLQAAMRARRRCPLRARGRVRNDEPKLHFGDDAGEIALAAAEASDSFRFQGLVLLLAKTAQVVSTSAAGAPLVSATDRIARGLVRNTGGILDGHPVNWDTVHQRNKLSLLGYLVGAAGFEPTTPSPPGSSNST